MALPDWLDIVPSSGRGDGELTASAAEHTGREPRSYAVTAIPDGADPVTLELTQPGKSVFVDTPGIPSGGFTVPAGGGTVEIEGVSNAASLVFRDSDTGFDVEGSLVVGDESVAVEDLFAATAVPGDPGASAQYAFRYLLRFAQHLGRMEKSAYTSIRDGAEQYGASGALFWLRQSPSGDFIDLDLPGLMPTTMQVPADGLKSLTIRGESNCRGLSWHRGNSSPWAMGLAMSAVLTATGTATGQSETVEMTEADEVYDIPGDPGKSESYSFMLAISRFPANTGRTDKSGKWQVRYSSGVYKEYPVAIVQPSPGEFCTVETLVQPSYSFPKTQASTLVIKGRSNSTNVWLRQSSGTPMAEMLVDGSSISEWDAGDTDPGNIYDFRGEDEDYGWELRISFAALPSGLIPPNVTMYLGWTEEDGTTHQLNSFTIRRT